MTTRILPVARLLGSLLPALFFLAFLAPVHADVFGRLKFSVKDADAEKPVAKASVTIKDPAGVRADVTLETAADGTAISPPLEIRAYQIATIAETFETDTRTVTVAADTTTDVEVLLEPQKEKVIKITGQRTLVRKNDTSSVTRRDQNFIQKIPSTAGNPQSLNRFTLTNPGFIQDSVNQVHPRGEHSATAIYLNGFKLPGALQGRAGQILTPDTIQNIDILTGGYSPEYGGETAAVLNVNLRSGPIRPVQSFFADAGGFNTLDQSLLFGGQLGKDRGVAGSAKQFGYFVSVSGRSTDNSLEPPQPSHQSAHNHGVSQSFFGNFNFTPSDRDQFSLILNDTPAQTQIANRTGLPDKYAPFGQGYGYGGALSASDAAAAGIGSQEQSGQDIYQNDENQFSVLNYRHGFSDKLTGLFSLGFVRSRLDVRNKNPGVNLNALPDDNSIEFNPTVLRKSGDTQYAGSLTYSQGKHTVKGGFLLDQQSGDESYNFVPASVTALNALAASDPDRILTPGLVQTGMDADGNPIYGVDPNNSRAPTLLLHRSGYYRAGYVQDTWRATGRLTVNYGLRLDSYKQVVNLSAAGVRKDGVEKTTLSPRLNAAYAITPVTIGRLIYDRLFIQPPLAQGAVLGSGIQPETYDHYEASLERQIGALQTVKVAYYYKNIHNQIDTGLLIPGTQIGLFASRNLQYDGVHGVELSYDISPRNAVGLGGYLAYTNLLARPNGVDNTGGHVEAFNDHDQLNTVSAGVSYTFPTGYFAGVNVYHGSGVFSSSLGEGQPRNAHTEVNLRFGAPRLAGFGGLQLDVQNVFNSVSVINFASDFSGTRFQQGRRVVLSLTGNF